MNDLMIEDYNVDYYDPFIEELIVGDNTLKKSIDLNLSQLDKYALIIVHTDHDCINFKLLNEANCLILDTRNIFKDESVYKKYYKFVGDYMVEFIPFYRPEINDEDIDRVVSALKSGWLSKGPKVIEFEEI